MDENVDASQAIFEPPPKNWRRPPGRLRTTWMKNIRDDLSLLDLGIHEARDLVQNQPLVRLMSLHSAMHSLWCMLLLDWRHLPFLYGFGLVQIAFSGPVFEYYI